MGANIDSLEIQLTANASKASSAIDILIGKLNVLNTSLTSINSGGLNSVSSGVNKLSVSMQGLKSVGAADYTRLAKGIEKISNLNSSQIAKAANALAGFGKGLQSLNSVSVSDSSLKIAELAKGISKLGYKSATGAIENIPKLADAMKRLTTELSTAPKVSQNIIDLTNALGNLSKTGASSGKAATSLSLVMDKAAKSSFVFGRGILQGGLSLKSFARQALAAAGIIGGIYGLIRGIRSSVGIASDLIEVQNVVDTVFGDMSYKVEEYAKNSIQQFGMSELALKQYSSRFQAMGVNMGIGNKAVLQANSYLNKQTDGYVDLSDSMADVSLTLTKLTADMASFYNLEQEDVSQDLQSIFTGQTRPLRKYGLDLTQATLQEWALKNGLDADISSMTQAEKTMLRYQYVLANTTAAQGDFARTANTWANQIRILKEQFREFGKTIGTGFISAFKPFIQTLNKVMANVISFSENVLNALGQIFGWTFEIKTSGVTNDLADAAEEAEDLSGNLGNAANNAKKLKTATLGIDELNINAPDDSGTAGSGSGAGTTDLTPGLGGLTTKITRNDTLIEAYKSNIKTLEQLGDYIQSTLSKTIENINWDKVYKKAENFGTGLADFLNGLIDPNLFYDLGSLVANSINTAIHSASAFVENFNWWDLGESIASGIKGFFENWDAGLTFSTFTNFVRGILKAVTRAVDKLSEDDALKDIGQKIVDIITSIDWFGLNYDLTNFFKALFSAMVDFPIDFATGIAEGIIKEITKKDVEIPEVPQFFKKLISTLSLSNVPGFKQINFIGDIMEIPNNVETFYSQISPFFDSVAEGVKKTSENVWNIIRNTFQKSPEWFKMTFYAVYYAVEEAFSNTGKFFEDSWVKIQSVFRDPKSFFKEKFEAGYKKIVEIFSPIAEWFSKKWYAIKNVFKDVKGFFTSAFQAAYNSVTGIWNGLTGFFKKLAENAFKPIKNLVNGVIKGINWVLDKVGSNKQFALWEGVRFEKGTGGLKRDTLGIVNDQAGPTYKELIVPPNGKPFIPEGRNVMMPLEKGTKIMPANQTKELIESGKPPMFAKGIGSFFGGAWDSIKSFTGNIMDYIMNPSDIVKVAIDKFTDLSGVTEPWISVATGAVNTIFDSVVKYVKKIFDTTTAAGVEGAVKWAIGIAGDNTHGYDQGNRWGRPDYDCSALVISAFEQAGIKLKSAGATYTGNIYGAAKNIGFSDVTRAVNLGNASGMKRGDILLSPGNHVAMYIGNGQVVQASSNEFGGIRGGKPGDQTGREINVSGYYNFPWSYVLRYAKAFKGGIGSVSLQDIIPKFSVGGFPEDGFFMANKKEIVGEFSGRNAVVNNYQIESGIEEAAYRGFVRANSENTRMTSLLEELVFAVKEGKRIVVDGRELVEIVDSRKNRNGFSFT